MKNNPLRITYAQRRLIEKIEHRQLRRWCIENNLNHPTMYNIAIGNAPIIYKTICKTAHLIPPIEWLYYVDEPLPYEAVLAPQFDFTRLSRYIVFHRNDYKAIAKKYGLTDLQSYNVFVTYRTYPSISLIRAMCAEVDPIEFFVNSNVLINNEHVLDCGDIVSVGESVYFVLTKTEHNDKYKKVITCAIQNDCLDGIKLPDGVCTKGFVNVHDIQSYVVTKRLAFIEGTNSDFIKSVLEKVKSLFDI